MTKYQCTVCGFEYDQTGRTNQSDRFSLPVVGDCALVLRSQERSEGEVGSNSIEPFQDLPATWRCPKCGVLKNLFKEVEDGVENEHNPKKLRK